MSFSGIYPKQQRECLACVLVAAADSHFRNANLVFHRKKAEEWRTFLRVLRRYALLTGYSESPGVGGEAHDVRAPEHHGAAQRRPLAQAVLHVLVHVASLEVRAEATEATNLLRSNLGL